MTTHIVNLFKGSYLNTLQIHTFNDSGQNVLYNFSEATNSGYAIYDDAGTTKGQLFTTADNGTTWVPTPNSEISSLNNNYGSNFDLSNLSTNNANIAGTTNYDDGGSDMSGTFEIFSSYPLHLFLKHGRSSTLIVNH